MKNKKIMQDSDPPNKPEKHIPVKPDINPDPTKKNTPEKNDPTRIDNPEKTDPTRIEPGPKNSTFQKK